jgi:hypothetical protein
METKWSNKAALSTSSNFLLLSNLEWVDCRVKCGRKPGEANA